MTLDEILALDDFKKIQEKLCISREIDIGLYRDQYNGKHEILDRPVKLVGPKGKKKKVDQAKIVSNFQKKIVRMAVSFLFGNQVKVVLNNSEVKRNWRLKKEDKLKNVYDELIKVLDDNKIKYFDKKLARNLFIETHVAELWYTLKEEDGFKPKVMLLTKENGDEIFPHFDVYGRMDAFTRKYTVTRYNVETKTDEKIETYDIYTKDKIITWQKPKGGEWEKTEVSHPYGKIPVIYYMQEKTEWADEQPACDAYEMLVSKVKDMNAYFSAPSVKVKGKIENPPDKETVGKMFTIKGEKNPNTGATEYGDIEYLTWKYFPESLEFEKTSLKEIIFGNSSTPDLSFDNLKGKLGNLSGIAIKLMFMDAQMKATEHEELFGECYMRRLNVIKAILKQTNKKIAKDLDKLDLSVKFSDMLPKNLSELIESLSMARGGEPIMSRESAVKQNPLIEDIEEELELMETEGSEVKKLSESYEV